MTQDDLDLVRGSGNIFRDFGDQNADLEQLRCLLAAEIIKVLDEQALTVREASQRSGFAAADFSRVRQVNLGRFTVDHLMLMLERLDQKVEVSVKVKQQT
ncbi:hypothetical protein PCC7418_0462 [Halothece sp. PCC 7418]|uniref:helix-turn-helix domain-containing protein n=1 Tax=Halothece sp. (strain PCC 7418) TaxID=65093 RepID=UPI0002A07911|nr:helix-turn-helix transcriptional regulator [Halothece sp. PCC 7418]AFZ42692.1 hypothetical protein PCC7418_0462 [Halothece sp. PCC 7418]